MDSTKYVKKLTASIVLAVLLLSFTAAAATTQVSLEGVMGNDPVTNGNKIIYVDASSNIHIYDPATDKDTKISRLKKAKSYVQASSPAVSGDKLVWLENGSKKPQLVVYDLLTGGWSSIRTDSRAVVDAFSKPSISGNKVVWSSDHKIYLRDMEAHSQRYVVDGDDPAIDGNRIVYTRDNGDRPDVYCYDLGKKSDPETLITWEGDNYYVQISGDKVIWSDFTTRVGHIMMYDMASRAISVVTSPNAEMGGQEVGEDTGIHPGISGNKIVYEKYGSDAMGSAGIYVYDIMAQDTVMVAGIDALQESNPAILGNRIVWVNQGAIYTSLI